VIIAVEKVTDSQDYYVETDKGDDLAIVNYYRHGQRRGSNYLYFDGHVDWLTYADASGPGLINWNEDQGKHGSDTYPAVP